MIACSNCQHINPEGATQCEACFTPLPATIDCPHCGTPIQADANFCGQCGLDLVPNASKFSDEESIPTVPTTLSQNKQKTSLSSSSPGATTESRTLIASLFHVQTQTIIQMPQKLRTIHLGKPNDRVPPDIDVSSLPDAEIVSRVHAEIRCQEGDFFLEDIGSSNGTYVNHAPLIPGTAYLLHSGDHIALGKEDKVSFIFQINSKA